MKSYCITRRSAAAISGRGKQVPEFKRKPARVYNAAGNTQLRARILGQQLEIRAIHCDTIEDFPPNPIPRNMQEALEIADDVPDISIIPGEDLATSVLRTQVADVRYDLHGVVLARHNAMDWKLMMKEASTLSPSDMHPRTVMHKAFERANETRKLCRTRRNFVGLVPCAALAGDQVFAFLGGQVLYVLRARGDYGRTYEFIGECYLHGLMDGEALQASPDFTNICLV